MIAKKTASLLKIKGYRVGSCGAVGYLNSPYFSTEQRIVGHIGINSVHAHAHCAQILPHKAATGSVHINENEGIAF